MQMTARGQCSQWVNEVENKRGVGSGPGELGCLQHYTMGCQDPCSTHIRPLLSANTSPTMPFSHPLPLTCDLLSHSINMVF